MLAQGKGCSDLLCDPGHGRSLATRRVAQATGQTALERPPQIYGADYLPVQLTIRFKF